MRNDSAILRASPELVRLTQQGLLEIKGDEDDLDVKGVLEDIARKQNERLAKLEERFNARADDIEVRLNRFGMSAGSEVKGNISIPEWKNFLLSGAEFKDMTVGSSPDGGFAVPDEWSSRIITTVLQTSPMRQVSNVETVSTSELDFLVDKDDFGSGWVSETQSRPATTSAQLAALKIPTHEIYANPQASQKLLDDSRLDIEAWLANKVAKRLSRKENTAFVSGNGVGQPWGFLSFPNVANASYAWGSLGYIATGAAGAFAASPNQADALKSLKYSLKAEYRDGAVYMMNSDTAAVISQFKDTTGRYVWADSVSQGEPPTLFGSPVVFAEDMPAIAANSFSVAYGNFKEGYTIVDRYGIRVLRDPYTNKPNVSFYTTKRVGGSVTNFEAIKLLKFAVS